MAVRWGMTRVRMGMDGRYLATNRAVRPVLLYTMIRLACRTHPRYGLEKEGKEECVCSWQPTRLNEQKRWAAKTSFIPCP